MYVIPVLQHAVVVPPDDVTVVTGMFHHPVELVKSVRSGESRQRHVGAGRVGACDGLGLATGWGFGGTGEEVAGKRPGG